MHYIYYNLTYWPCLKTWQSLLPCKPIASKLCISIRVKIQALSIYMTLSQKDHDWGNLRNVSHHEGACDGPVWPKSIADHNHSKHFKQVVVALPGTKAQAWLHFMSNHWPALLLLGKYGWHPIVGRPVRFTKPPAVEWLCCFLQNISVAFLRARYLSGE